MLRFIVTVPALAACVACSADTATKERPPVSAPRAQAAPADPGALSISPDPADRAIRHDLESAIAQDSDLQKRAITFRVTHGDISVTGVVNTEEERRRINDLAMNIEGVKSIANGLHVAE